MYWHLRKFECYRYEACVNMWICIVICTDYRNDSQRFQSRSSGSSFSQNKFKITASAPAPSGRFLSSQESPPKSNDSSSFDNVWRSAIAYKMLQEAKQKVSLSLIQAELIFLFPARQETLSCSKRPAKVNFEIIEDNSWPLENIFTLLVGRTA